MKTATAVFIPVFFNCRQLIGGCHTTKRKQTKTPIEICNHNPDGIKTAEVNFIGNIYSLRVTFFLLREKYADKS
jgi:hypothetical protein